jgi:hypothetical protein
MRVVLQLMKLARQKELLRFFQWLAGISAKELPDNLLGLMLLYAQGVWFDESLDGGGVKDEIDGLGWVALADLEPTRQRLVRAEGG